MHETIEDRFREALPDVQFCSLRVVEEASDTLTVRRGVAEPASRSLDTGAMVTVMDRGGLGYAATPDLSASGLRDAVERARDWAHASAKVALFDTSSLRMPESVGEYETPVTEAWDAIPIADKFDLLHEACASLDTDTRIVERTASLWRSVTDTLYLTSAGGRVRQRIHMLSPDLSASANNGAETQTRSLGSGGETQQGGLEVLERVGFVDRARGIAEQAIALLGAPNCPSGCMDVVLAPDQMMLQIHESIGHPLELDRILGDERNYAGRSFVTPDMFGTYRYGSDLLNVTYDPGDARELATYAFDDDGVPAERTFLIRDGVLERPLGSIVSQHRANMPGVANARATSWNRPPIDRMANLNVEPGTSSFDDLVAGVERGIYMATNLSWSIDDSRNKFQFGCEWARLIENGELGGVVKNPNYRGVSATFWRSLSGVGDADTFAVMGTPYCGKGEPNQVIRVGHASPACRFSGVDVFGGG